MSDFLPPDPNAATRNFIRTAMDLRASPEKFVELFHPDSALHVIGSRRDRPYFGTHRGRDQILQALRAIDGDMEMHYRKLLGVVIEGEAFAVRRLMESRHRGTSIVTQIVVGDLVRLRQGRIAEVLEFVDTSAMKRFDGDHG